MKISGFSKLTLLDYPKTLACEIFTQGCNFKCPFCQNSPLIKNEDTGLYSEEDVLNYLTKRKNILEGIVITGGEPTMQNDLIDFIKKVKVLGYKVKLDTNGFRPNIIEKLINANLVDYVAMDIKNSLEKYNTTCGLKNMMIDNIRKSINILKNSNIEHEFRTTIIKEYHTKEDILKILELVGDSNYYLQNFEMSENVIDKTLHGFTNIELLDMQHLIDINHKNVTIRGIRYENEGGKIYV